MAGIRLQWCVSLASKVCRPARPLNTLTKTQRATHSWTHLCCGQQGRAQVLTSRCGWVSRVHLHFSSRQGDPRSATHHQLDEPECLPAWQQDNLHRSSRKPDLSDTAMRILQDVFSLSQKDALYVLISSNAPEVSKEDVISNLHLLQQSDINGEQVVRIPWILGHKSDVLDKKLLKIKESHLFREHFEGLGFCYLSLDQMTMYQQHFRKEAQKFPHHPNRIYYLAERIQVPVEIFSEKIGRPHRTLLLSIGRLDSIIDMFHKYSLSPEDIVSDLWVFEYSLRKAEERLRRASELGCTELRPWMCRCSAKIFDRFCERYQCGKELMGEHKSLFSYLSERLDCDTSLLEKAFQSNEVMNKVHISKFSRILDLLYAEGITAQEIRSCMRVFQYSEERTTVRIKELKKLGFFPFPLILLCRTPGQFKEIVSVYKRKFNSRVDIKA